MFSNFIYFISAILLFGAYGQANPSMEKTDITFIMAAFVLTIFFFVFEFIFFKNLLKRVSNIDPGKADILFTRTSGLFAIAVLMIYAAFIYLLNISQLLPDAINSSKTESIRSLSMLALFISLITIHWAVSYPSYKKIYDDREGILKHVKSQLMFSLPVFVPWLSVLALSDILYILPFNGLNEWLLTRNGEICLLAFLVIGMSFIAPFLIKAAWGCKTLPDNYSLEVINDICGRTGVKFRKILEWPLKGGNAITAGVMGIFGRFRYLLITPALIRSMSDEELGAVIAHEAGHVKYRHMMLYIVVIGAFSVASIIVSPSFEELILFSGFFSTLTDQYGITGRSLSFIPGLFSVIFLIVFIRFVFGYFMRIFERQADVYAMRIMGSPAPLVKAFCKIVWLSRQDPEKPSWHHYSIKERIDFILKCDTDIKAVKNHDRKVFLSLSFYLICILSIIFAADLYEKSEKRDHLFNKFLLEASKGALKPQEIDQIMADSYYIKGNLKKSAFFYEQANSKDPDNPEILNSLAWIYATSEKKEISAPLKAVELAKKAITLKPDSPHIWDTYAESLYSASDFAGAVNSGEKALSLAEEKDRVYYERQLEKFMKKAALK